MNHFQGSIWRMAIGCGMIASAFLLQVESGCAQTIEESITVNVGEFQLAATLICPSNKGPFPCVIITHGSEAGIRAWYKNVAKRFVDRGFAVVVYDKRGCGESTGTYVESPDLQDPSHDLIACVKAVKANPLVDSDHIGVFGVSQGGWVGPLAASTSEDISFVIMVSGPSISPLEQNLFDKGNQLKKHDLNQQEIADITNVRRLVWTYLAFGTGEDEAQAAWDKAKSKPWFHVFTHQIPMGKRDRLLKHPRLINYAAHTRYDPEPALRSLKVPVLAIYGDADSIVPAERCSRLLESFFNGDRSSLLTVKRFAGADHGIRVSNNDGKRSFANGYWSTVLDWTTEITRDMDNKQSDMILDDAG